MEIWETRERTDLDRQRGYKGQERSRKDVQTERSTNSIKRETDKWLRMEDFKTTKEHSAKRRAIVIDPTKKGTGKEKSQK